jgi:SAM-dependent methyltransferase
MALAVACRACGSPDTQPRYRLRGYNLVECRRCASMTTAHRMNAAEAEAYYGSGYFHGGDYEDYQATEATSKRNFTAFIERLRRVRPSGRLLEIGCAYGYFLDLACRHWEVTGIDISADAISSISQRFPIAAYQGDLLTVALSPASYDWTVAWDVIEHLDSPRRYAARCFELLAPGGCFALTTGDVSSSYARLFGRRWRLLTPPSHLTFFSRQGMQMMLNEAGFERILFDTAGYHRSLGFTLFRLFGPELRGVMGKLGSLAPKLLERSFYLNLGDIMFVLAHKPA